MAADIFDLKHAGHKFGIGFGIRLQEAIEFIYDADEPGAAAAINKKRRAVKPFITGIGEPVLDRLDGKSVEIIDAVKFLKIEPRVAITLAEHFRYQLAVF